MKKIEEDIELCKFNGVDAAAVYIGGLTDLVQAQKLKWRKADEELCRALDLDVEVLRLSEIAEQLKEAYLITIIIEEPFSGRILQYGNYCDGTWYEIGTTYGYA